MPEMNDSISGNGTRLERLRVGLIGYGAIGRRVAQRVLAGEAGDVAVVAILVRDAARAAATGRVPVTDDLGTFLGQGPDAVVEAAGGTALRKYAEPVLEHGCHLIPVSVGALVDPEVLARVRAASDRGGGRVFVPSGAIAALDAIGAAALGGLESVRHTVRKPVAAFTAEQLAGRAAGEAAVLFEGSVLEGARLFPENVNVAAAVVLAGAPPERTTLRVMVDPAVSRNTHELEAEGWFGRLRLTIENVPTENPKTGRIVALSVVKALRSLVDPVVVGC